MCSSDLRQAAPRPRAKVGRGLTRRHPEDRLRPPGEEEIDQWVTHEPQDQAQLCPEVCGSFFEPRFNQRRQVEIRAAPVEECAPGRFTADGGRGVSLLHDLGYEGVAQRLEGLPLSVGEHLPAPGYGPAA